MHVLRSRRWKSLKCQFMFKGKRVRDSVNFCIFGLIFVHNHCGIGNNV